ncbi:MAG: PKD domain-containing protein [Chitinophagaceae bacterium]
MGVLQTNAQVSSGIRADGKIIAHGDTVYVCKNKSVRYESSSSGSLFINWRFQGGNPSTGFGIGPFNVSYNAIGYDTTFQVVEGSNGFADSTFIIVCVSDIYPVADYTFATDGVCGNVPIQFTNISTGTDGPLNYVWSFGDGNTTGVISPSHQFLSAIGTTGSQPFNVKLLVTNALGCADSTTRVVTVQKIPDAAMGNNLNPAVNYGVFNNIPTFKRCDAALSYNFQFTNTSTTIPINTEYTIQWGDGLSPDSTFTSWPAGTIVYHTFPRGGSNMTVSVKGANGCIGIKKYLVFLGTIPGAGLGSNGDRDICSSEGLSFSINNTASNPPGTLYIFTVNDGTPSQTFQHPPPATVDHYFSTGSCGVTSAPFNNSYKAELLVSNPCGLSNPTIVPIYVSGKPRPGISIPAPVVCVNTTVPIFSSSSFGNTITSNGGFISDCFSTGKIVWEIVPSTGYTLLSGTYGSFNGNPTNGVLWTPGSTGLNVNFNTAGTYTIKLTLYNERCGYVTGFTTICVRNPPTASFTMSKKKSCAPETIAFTNTSSASGCQGNSYFWEVTYADPLNCNPGGAGSGYTFMVGGNTSASPSINFYKIGRYAIRLTTTAIKSFGCQVAYAYDTFYVTGPPKAAVVPIGNICAANSITPSGSVISCYSIGTFTYEWNFTGGIPATSTNLNPGAISYAATGTYPVQFIVKDDECGLSDTVNTTVTITDKPVAEAGNSVSVCSGQVVPIGMPPISGVTYQWSPATGLSNPSIANPIATLTYNGPAYDTTYKFYFTASQGVDCSNIDSVEINVKRKPILAVTPSATAICSAGSVTITASGAEDYTWSPASGLDNTISGTVIASPLITTTYNVTGSLANGCTATGTATVTVTQTPIAEAGNAAVICSGTSVPVGAAPVAGITYQWTPSTGLSNGNISNPTATPIYTGTALDTVFTYYLTASVGGNCQHTDSVKITVKRQPVVTLNPTASQICIGNNVTITASGADSYTWLPSATLDVATGAVVKATPITTTTYTVTGSLPNGCSDQKNITVTVIPDSKALFIAPDTVKCAPVNINTLITNTVYPAGNGTYNWYANGISIASNTNGAVPSYILNTPGQIVTIKLVTISAAGCKPDSMQKIFKTVPSVTAAFTKDKTSSCAPLNVTFTNTSTSLTDVQFFWNFGNGVLSTDVQPAMVTYGPSVTFRDTMYYIVLKAFNGCDTSYYRDSVKVFALPNARFGVDTTRGCSPFTVHITNTSRGNNFVYYWDFGDGHADTTFTLGGFTHTYYTGSITTFPIRLIAENQCSRDTQTIYLVVSPNLIQPFITANGNQLAGCSPHLVTFNNSSVGASQLNWNFGDNSAPVIIPNTQNSISHIYNNPGNYTVTIRLQNDCSDTTIYRTVTVYAPPTAAFDVAVAKVCTSLPLTVINHSTNANSYEWSWGDGSPTSSFTNGQHIYNNTGPYTIRLVATRVHSGGFTCTDTAYKPITVVNKIPAQITVAPGKFCEPYTLNVNAGNISGYNKIEWVIYDSSTVQGQFTVTGTSATHIYTKAGTYSVKLIVHTTDNCIDSVTYPFQVFRTPKTTFTPTLITTCNHDTTVNYLAVTTNQGTDPISYSWFVNNSIEGSAALFTRRFQVPLTNATPAEFIIRALAENPAGCGDTSLPGKVIVQPLPWPGIVVSPSLVQQQPDYTFIFKDTVATNPNKTYLWTMGDRSGQTRSDREVKYEYGDTGTYQVKLLVKDFGTGCSARDSVKVTVLFIPGYLYVPNAMCLGCSNNSLRQFLPLGKGLKKYRLTIYTSWGEKVFETTSLNADGSPNVPWDGRVNGKILQQNAYTWQMEGMYKNGTEWKGMIYPGSSKPVKAGFITIIK